MLNTAEYILFIMALLAAPACLLVGVAAGAIFTHRLMKGLPPVPAMRFPTILRPKRKDEGETDPAYRLPTVKA